MEDNKKITITLIPGLSKSILDNNLVKSYYFYSFLKSKAYSGTIKNYNLQEIARDLKISERTVKRRLGSLSEMQWIKDTKKDIHVRGLHKVALYLKVNYNKNPNKTRHTLDISEGYRSCLNLVRLQVLKSNLDAQNFNFKRKLSNLSKSYSQVVKKGKASITDLQFFILNESIKDKNFSTHSRILTALDFTLSRDQIADLWNCSPIEASRGIKALSDKKLVKDTKRLGFLKKGSYNEAMMLRKNLEDDTIFYKNGSIYKKLKNKVEVDILNPDFIFEGEGMRKEGAYISKFGEKEFHHRIIKRLNQRVNKRLSLITTGLMFSKGCLSNTTC